MIVDYLVTVQMQSLMCCVAEFIDAQSHEGTDVRKIVEGSHKVIVTQ